MVASIRIFQCIVVKGDISYTYVSAIYKNIKAFTCHSTSIYLEVISVYHNGTHNIV